MESGRRSFDAPDERSEIAGGRVIVERITVGGVVAVHTSHAPGWRWTEHSSPEVGEPRCPKTHVGMLTEGRLHVEPAEGPAFEVGPGDVVVIQPGHDAWTVGDEPAVLVELER